MVEGVLLLNATYEPLGVITVRRAVNLLLRDRVEAAAEQQVSVASASSRLDVPRVLRLKVYINVPRRGAVAWSRRNLLARDNYMCAYCGRHAGAGGELSLRDLTIDHVVPKSRGGGNGWTNTVTCCKRCNTRKGGRTPHEAGMKLLFEPKMPRTNYLVFSGNLPAEWKLWLEVPS
jgi:5-methylcytosine-specific restriction endonuclease McrA